MELNIPRHRPLYGVAPCNGLGFTATAISEGAAGEDAAPCVLHGLVILAVTPLFSLVIILK